MTGEPGTNEVSIADSAARGLAGKLRQSILWLGSTAIIWQFLSWLLTLLTLRVLKPADYGVAAMVETFTPFLTLICGFNIATWLVQHDAIDPNEERAVLSLTCTLGALTAIAAMLGAGPVAKFYGAPQLRAPIQLVALTFLLQGIQTIPMARLQRAFLFKQVGLMNLAVGVSRSLLQIALAILGYGYWALFFGLFYGEAARTVWLGIAGGLPRGFRWDMRIFRLALAYGLPATAANALWFWYSTADNIAVGRLFTPEVFGTYAVAFFLTDLPLSKINSILRPTLLPYFTGLRADPEQLHAAFFGILRMTAALVYPILVGVLAVAPEAVPMLLGAKWAGLVRPLEVMCCVGILRGLTTNVEPLLLALGKPRATLICNAVSAIVLPPSFFLLGWLFGINGIYATWLFVFPPTSFITLLVLKKITGITPLKFLVNLRTPLVASLAMGAALWVTNLAFVSRLGPLPLFVVKVVLGMLVYGGVCWFVFRKDVLETLQTIRGLRG